MNRPQEKWFEKAFDQRYQTIYRHRSAHEAFDAVRFAIEALSLFPGSRCLDVACGAGRHMAAMTTFGIVAYGLDLSRDLLQSARASYGLRDRLVRADMRAIPFAGRFDAVTSFFTSFGYFDDPADDAAVLSGIARALKPGGRFLFDFMNAPFVRATLVRENVEDKGSLRLQHTRRIDEATRRVIRDTDVFEDGRFLEHRLESVRLYEPEEIDRLLTSAGLIPTARFGDLHGTDHSASSPRCVTIANLRRDKRNASS
jgi:SAM-dependent methyltransferase